MNNNEPVRVEGYEVPVDVLLEAEESISDSVAVATVSEWDSDEFKHELEGGLAREIHQRANTTEVLQRTVNFSDAVTDETHFEAEEASERLGKCSTEDNFFASLSDAEERHLAKSVRLFDLIKSTPEYQLAREEYIAASGGSTRSLEKRSTSGKVPRACGEGMIRCGCGTAKVERVGKTVTEYDEHGSVLRAYVLEADEL